MKILILIVLIFGINCININDVNNYAAEFNSALDDLHDSLGSIQYQEELDGIDYNPITVNTNATIKDIADKLSVRLQKKIGAALKLRDRAVELELDSGSVQLLQDMCFDKNRFSGKEYNSQFFTKVDFESGCLRYPKSQFSDLTNGILKGLDSDMTKHREIASGLDPLYKELYDNDTTLRWMYFGAQSGLFRIYPAVEQSSIGYDPRFRPWFIQSATSARDVVIIIDRSGSMTGPKWNQAVEAAQTILTTLNPQDRVNVLMFSNGDSAWGPRLTVESDVTTGFAVTSEQKSCFSSNLVAASSQNVAILSNWINSIKKPSGGTDYLYALTKAYDILDNLVPVPNEDFERAEVLLFLTDGEQTKHTETRTLIRNRQQDKPSRLLFIYGFDLTSGAANDLVELAAEANGGQNSLLTSVGATDDLRTVMNDYYNSDLLKNNSSGVAEYVLSAPYRDSSGLGIVITVAAPCINNDTQKLFGVVGIDVEMEEVLADLTYFRQGELTYPFLIDTKGNTFYHPGLPSPKDYRDDPFFVNITKLEMWTSGQELITYYSKIVSQQNGTIAGRVITKQRGDGSFIDYTITYKWEKVPNTDFIVVIAIDSQEVATTADYNVSPANPKFDTVSHYHRYLATKGTCSQFGNWADKTYSSWKVAPSSFKDPYYYLSVLSATQNEHITMEGLANGEDPYTFYFEKDVYDDILLTSGLNEWYKNTLTDKLSQFVVWRYIGTERGVFRNFPGAMQSKEYDPRGRGWYLGALANPQKLVFSTPYEDAFGAGTVITLSQSVYRGASQHAKGDPIDAVAGMDFSVAKFALTFTQAIPVCSPERRSTCILFNHKAEIVYHSDFVYKGGEVEGVGLAQKFPTFAETLLSTGFIEKHECTDYGQSTGEVSFQVKDGSVSGTFSASGIQFFVREVEGTNLFLLVSERSVASTATCEAAPTPLSYCPAEAPLIFDSCASGWEDTKQPCDLETSVTFTPIAEKPSASEQACFDFSCDGKANAQDCISFGCIWCVIDDLDNEIPVPFCAIQQGDGASCPATGASSVLSVVAIFVVVALKQLF